MERVFPDSNVLYPISVADLTLRLADVELHKVLWSEDLLAEVKRVLIDRKGLSPDNATYFCDCIRDAFPDDEVAQKDYQDLIQSRTGPDPDDHPHSAAAMAGGATVLLTSDTKGFPKRDLGDVRRATPDTYYVELLEAHPDVVLAVVEEMGTHRRDARPIEATLEALAKAGMKQFAQRAAALLEPPASP